MTAQHQQSTAIDVARLEEIMGLELLPWQRSYVEAINRGEPAFIARGKSAGWSTLRRALAALRQEDCTPDTPTNGVHRIE